MGLTTDLERLQARRVSAASTEWSRKRDAPPNKKQLDVAYGHIATFRCDAELVTRAKVHPLHSAQRDNVRAEKFRPLRGYSFTRRLAAEF